MRRLLLVLIVPLVLLGRGLLGDAWLLPLAPAALQPLASEVASAPRVANYLTADRLFPTLTDELAIERSFAAGELPLWQPLQGTGAPLAAGTMAGPWYPPNVLAWIFGPVGAAPWRALVSLVLAGLGAWLLLERRGLEFGACAVGAIGFQLSGYLAANIELPMKLDAALWLPWCWWAVEGLLQQRRFAGIALAAYVALSLLAGFPGVAALCAAATGAYALVRALEERQLSRALPRVALFAALGLTLGAVQLVPTWEASQASLRGLQSLDELAPQSLPLSALGTLVVPQLFGAPQSALASSRDPLVWLWTDSAAKAEHANALEWNLFAGVAIVALACGGLLLDARRARAEWIVGALALAFALGAPLVEQLARVPGLDLGTPARAVCIVALVLPLLAARGVQAIVDRRVGALLVPTLVALALLVGGAVLASWAEPERWLRSIHETIAAKHGLAVDLARAELPESAVMECGNRVKASGVRLASSALVLLAALVLCGRIDPERRSRLRWILFAIAIGFEGWRAAVPHIGWTEPRELFPRSEAMDAIARAAGDGRVLRLDESADGVSDVLALARPNLPEAYGVADLTPYIAFQPRWTVELLAALDPHSRYRSGASRISDPRVIDGGILDRLRVTCVLARRELADPRLELAWSRPEFFVYRRAGSVPRVRVARGVQRLADDSEVLAQLATDALDPRESVLVADGLDTKSSGTAASARIVAESAREIAVEASAGGGMLVLADAWYPGWRATLREADGRERELDVLRVDNAFRGVELPQSACTVTFRYEPASWTIGLALSSLALLVTAGIAWKARSAPGAGSERAA